MCGTPNSEQLKYIGSWKKIGHKHDMFIKQCEDYLIVDISDGKGYRVACLSDSNTIGFLTIYKSTPLTIRYQNVYEPQLYESSECVWHKVQ
jgi:hypothetical protein